MAAKGAPAHSWLMERRYRSLVIAAFFVFLAAITFFVCYRQITIHTDHILKQDRATANLLSIVLDERVKKIISVMESYSQRPLLIQAAKNRNEKEARNHLIDLVKSNADIDFVILSDRWGTPWATSYPGPSPVIGRNFSYRDWYKGVSKEWKPYITDVVLRVVQEKDLAVQISVPLFNEKKDVIGILVNTQRTVGLNHLFEQAPLDPDAFITVTDRKGQIVYRSRQEIEKEIKSYPFHPAMNNAVTGENKTFIADDPDPGGRTCYVSFAPVSNVGWAVFVERDKRSIFLSEMAYYLQVTAIAFLLFLSTVLFLAYSRKQITSQYLQEQLQADKEIRASQETAERLAEEMVVLAEIGRVIGSTLEIDRVYERMAKEIRKLISFDSLIVNLLDAQRETLEVGYVSALEIPGRRVGDLFPLRGTVVEDAIRTRKGLIIQLENPERLVDKFPSLTVSVRAGMLTIMSVPLITQDEVFGNLMMRSKKPVAYTEQDLRLAEKIGMQISGAIANAQLFKNLSKTERMLRESSNDQKKIQEELRQLNVELEQRVDDRTAQLSAANKELEAFSYSVSHDLRAPLRSINGFSQALLEEYQGKLDETGKIYLERVCQAARRMGVLIDDMMKLSKVVKSEFNPEAIDLGTMVRAIAEARRDSSRSRETDLIVQEGVVVQGDPHLMRIALENLVDNAIKFTSKEANPRIEFGTTVSDGRTACFIRDNGVGFDMAYADKLFGAFQRLHTKEEFPGTGIGLATVQRIIHRHGGRVWAEGEVGKGAMFYFTLP